MTRGSGPSSAGDDFCVFPAGASLLRFVSTTAVLVQQRFWPLYGASMCQPTNTGTIAANDTLLCASHTATLVNSIRARRFRRHYSGITTTVSGFTTPPTFLAGGRDSFLGLIYSTRRITTDDFSRVRNRGTRFGEVGAVEQTAHNVLCALSPIGRAYFGVSRASGGIIHSRKCRAQGTRYRSIQQGSPSRKRSVLHVR